MRVLSKLLIILFLFLLSSFIVVAIPAAPSPSCEIIGEIIKVDKNLFYNNFVHIKIQEVDPVSKNGLEGCERVYPPGNVDIITPMPQKNVFSVGQTVKGIVHFSGDEREHGTYFKDYEIIFKSELPIHQKVINWFKSFF